MKTRKPRTARASVRKSPKACHSLKAGPWAGKAIWLDSYGGGNTGWLQIGAHVGRYNNGQWQDMGGGYHNGRWVNPGECD